MKKPKQPKVTTRETKPSPFTQRVKDATITPDDMLTYQRTLNAMSPEQVNDPTGRYIGILRAFGMMNDPDIGTGIGDEKHTRLGDRIDKLAAIQTRFEAFGKLVDLEEFRAYRLPAASDDELLINVAYLHVAATAPLTEDPKGELYFDADGFAQRMLAHIRAEGTG